MKYLFWNTHKNTNINPLLCEIIIENNISIAILAEYDASIDNLIDLVHLSGISMKEYPSWGSDRIRILGTKGLDISPNLQTDHSSIHVINKNIILCCVHLNSQIYSDSIDLRQIDMEQIITDVLAIEKRINTKKTIITGDFNINPYDDSCVNSRYFHGIPIYQEAKRESRTVRGKEYYMFYNPMWNFLGDFNEPYGTYYYNSSKAINPYWNIYDQVIIRPALRKSFVDNSLRIVTETSTTSLLDKKKHPNKKISDHLPIIFEIKENNYE